MPRPRLDPKIRPIVTSLKLLPAVIKALDARAAEEGCTRGEVIRRAVDAALKRKARPAKRAQGGSNA